MSGSGRRAGGPADGRSASNGDSGPAARPPARPPPAGRLLGVDWGTKRIGLAISDPSRTIAQPLATLTRRAGRRFPMRQLRTHLDRWQPAGIVVGLPLEADGTEGAAAREAREMAEQIARTTGLPVTLVDERMTTARALAQSKGRRADRATVDQRAAAVLLQWVLDRERNG